MLRLVKDIDYGRVIEVMGRLHKGGITQIGLVSAPPVVRVLEHHRGSESTRP